MTALVEVAAAVMTMTQLPAASAAAAAAEGHSQLPTWERRRFQQTGAVGAGSASSCGTTTAGPCAWLLAYVAREFSSGWRQTDLVRGHDCVRSAA